MRLVLVSALLAAGCTSTDVGLPCHPRVVLPPLENRQYVVVYGEYFCDGLVCVLDATAPQQPYCSQPCAPQQPCPGEGEFDCVESPTPGAQQERLCVRRPPGS